ncbi:monovalent cation/H(+) antiporter subunit G [Candidatus Omnitrophota bacterium]
MSNLIGLIIISIGLVFDFFGCVGLMRLPDIYNRLQAATKCVTLGTCFILAGTMVMSGFTALSMKALICMIFILLTSPTAAHAIAKGAYKAGVKLWEGSVVDKYKEKNQKG